MRTLRNWGIVYNPYAAPEVMVACAFGKLPDGRSVRTSDIVEVIGALEFRTRSGTHYSLEEGDCSTSPENLELGDKPLEHVRRCLEIQASLRSAEARQ